MTIPLNEMTIKSEKVLYRLKAFLDQIGNWENFDTFQLFHVYVNSEKDFCSMEARSHKINFTSAEHKMAEIIYSKYEISDVSYQELRDFIASL